MSVAWVIAGLGNPGRTFRENRHNAGFHGSRPGRTPLGHRLHQTQNQALIAEARSGGDKVLLAKPQTMMNLSGRAVAPLTRYYRVPSNSSSSSTTTWICLSGVFACGRLAGRVGTEG